MKNKKTIFLISIITLILILTIVLFLTQEKNLIKLNYNEVMTKIENKEDFVLCISAKECIHCQEYKPKLKKIAKEYNIIIYYINKNELSEDEYEKFKSKFSFDGATPTTIFFKDGEETTTANRIEGNVKTEKIINKLKSNGIINE